MNSTAQWMFSLLSLILIGLGIGWLAGLSNSPVVATLLASLLGTALAIVTALSGLKLNKQTSSANESENAEKGNDLAFGYASPIPIGLVMLGIILGTSTGIYFKAHDLLGVKPQPVVEVDTAKEVKMWEELGLSKIEVAKKLFEHKYSTMFVAKQTNPVATNQQPKSSTVLFNTMSEECQDLRAAREDEIFEMLDDVTGASFNKLRSIIGNNPKQLKELVEILCASSIK